MMVESNGSPSRDLALAGRRVLVTGAAGFIGANLVERLVAAGARVTALVRPSSQLWRLGGVREEIELLPMDLLELDAAAPPEPLRDVQIIYHLAAVGMDPLQQDVEEILRHNLSGTLRMLQLAERIAPERVIYCGSGHEYGSASAAREDALPAPASTYGVSKAAGWMLAQARARHTGLPLVSLRPFAVYGPSDVSYRLIPYCVRRALAGAPLDITGGEQTRDFVYVADVVEAFLAASVADDAVGGTFNVCTGTETAVRDLVEAIVKATGSPSAARFGTRPYRENEMWAMSGDPRRAAEVLGWRAATPLHEGLERTVAWFRARQEADLDHLPQETGV